MSNIFALVSETKNIEITQDNMKLNISVSGDNTEFMWLYTENGVDFSPKSLSLSLENGVLKELLDGWFLLKLEALKSTFPAMKLLQSQETL